MSKTPKKAKTAFDKRDQEIVGLRELLRTAQREREAALGQKAHADFDRQAAVDMVEKLRAERVVLKRELAEAERMIQRQAGYLDRVLEGDAIKEGAARDVSRVEMATEPMRRGPLLHQARNWRGDDWGASLVSQAHSAERETWER